MLVDFLVMMGCYDFMLNDFWVGLDEMIVSSLGFRFGRLVFVRWASPILNIYIYANRMQVRTDSSFRSPGPVRLKTAPCSDQGKRAADSGAWLRTT